MSIEIDAEIVATCEAAVTYLTEHGLARHSFLTFDKRACAAGALVLGHFQMHGGAMDSPKALEDALRECPAMPAVAEVISERHPHRNSFPLDAKPEPNGVIFAFNDHLRTTQAEVIEVLQETIKRHTPDEFTSAPAEAS